MNYETMKTAAVEVQNEHRTALERFVYAKQLEDSAKKLKGELMRAANMCYTALSGKDPSKWYTVCNGLAAISALTPKSEWKYPDAIEKMAADLKAAQEKAQADGTATKKPGKVNPAEGQLFQIKLAK